MLIFETTVKGVSAAVIQRFVRRAQKLAKVKGEVDILISGNKRLQALNRHFRRKNKPTDVLSFPRPTGGDIAISADIARQNAALYGHSIAEELKILVLHGLLHLAGHDHESDHGQMARLESRLRAQLKLPSSLIDRTHASATSTKSAPARTRTATSTAKKRTRKPTSRKSKLTSRRTPTPRKTKSARNARAPRDTSTTRNHKPRSAQ
ncbi:MAG TPA: rRNA maturation RNase YbeY [Candidatus Angelobacter sp.]|jgi:probable rRNA maturation factor